MYSFTSRVRYSEIDETGKLSIPSLVNYLQDCTTFGSEELGLGPAHTAETGLAWLLSAWKIDIAELPSFGDEIRVSTWATGFKGLRASRNFTVCRTSDDAAAHPLVRADSSWFMFDASKGRPIRIPEKNIDWTFFRENIEGEYIWGNKGIQVNEDLAVDFKVQT